MLKFLIYSLVSAGILTLAWPSFGFPLLIFFGFVPLMMAEHKIAQSEYKFKGLKIFLLAYVCLFLWNALSLTWLYNALQRDEFGVYQNSISAYLPPALFNGLFMAIVFSIYSWVKRSAGNYYGLFFLPCIWMAFENLHLNWELAFPWFNLGNVFAYYPEWIQWYEYTGAFGGTLWIWIGNVFFFYTITAYKNSEQKKYLWNILKVGLPLIGLPILVSYIIYWNYEEEGEEITALVLQPELNPYTEKYETSPTNIVNDLVALSEQNITDKTQFVVAPETAFPGPGPGLFIQNLENDFLLNRFETLLENHPELTIVSGVELWQRYENEALATKTSRKVNHSFWWIDKYNSAIQTNKKDEIQTYHKSKLLVGIETFPYVTILKPIFGNLLLDFGGTVGTHGYQKTRSVFTNSYNNAKIAPIICWESVFGAFTTDYVKNGANVFFIMSNDSWWGNSDGHRLLLKFGNIRAIENRRSIVRSANSGISGFINQKGEVESFLEYEVEGALEGTVKLNNQLTFYTKYGDYIARIALLFCGIILAYTLSNILLKRFPKK